jgi:FlaA1/EpsC-like NDP-sugar epimerase
MSIEQDAGFSDKSKRLVLMVFDAILLPASLWVSVVLRYGELQKDVTAFWWLFPTVAITGVVIFYKFGLYRAIVRYIGPSAMLPVVQGVTIAALAISLIAYLSGAATFPRSSAMIFWFIAILAIGGGRVAVRTFFYGLANNYLSREPVIIYGAGESGAQLTVALINDKAYVPVAFIDDNRQLRRNTIHGVRVYSRKHLSELIVEYGVKQVLLAMPSATIEQRREILDYLSTIPVQVSTVPNFKDIVSGKMAVSEIQEIDIADLLGRPLVPPDEALLDHSIRGKSILITGAAGTIGSELCRKILARGPELIVLYDIAEFGLYQLNQQFEKATTNTRLIYNLGSILSEGDLQRVLEKYNVDTVYHAAAYKHVPMVESNMLEGVRNNALGTWRVLEAVSNSAVSELVMISSDKAVRPTNVMGASKRLAELFVQAFADSAPNGKTYCMVRFGNVLRSSGSVVPLFEEQIRQGGPVTVTHPEATRYFMTCSEASELVIQAGAMAEGGEIFVLDMGNPVVIQDLAEKMIHLHGKKLRADDETADSSQIIDMKFIGLRSGEKLKEELVIGENITGTAHPKVMKAIEPGLGWEEAKQLANRLEQLVRRGDEAGVRTILETQVTGYQPPETRIAEKADTQKLPTYVTPLKP